ncbi:MAG: MFS transporter [Ilumatobacter sp.]|nr:MFS transporter [Ilumatobacter sp.]
MIGAPPATGRRTHRTELALLTAAKTVANTALRWIGPFLPTLERAFSTTTGTLTGIVGVCELGGLSTVLTGPHLDRGRERRVFTIGMAAVAISSVIALIGTITSFAIAFGVLILGVTNLTVAGHAWIGHRVVYSARGRAIGAYETSWAIALLVGAPALAVLIAWFGWRGPFVALAIASGAAALGVHLLVADDAPLRSPTAAASASLPATAWFPMLASAATAAAGMSIFVVSGAWLDDDYGVSTGGLGLIAAGFGAIELASSTTVATRGDRLGARRSLAIGLVVLLVGCVVMAAAGGSRALAIVGLLVFLAGFEFGFVSSLTLMTEAAPQARGRALGISSGMGTVARAGAIVASGQLYEAFGIGGSLVMVATIASVALGFTAISRSPST